MIDCAAKLICTPFERIAIIVIGCILLWGIIQLSLKTIDKNGNVD